MTAAVTPKLGVYAAFSGGSLLLALALRRPEPALLAVPFLLALFVGLTSQRIPALDVTPALTRQRVLEGEDTVLEIGLTASDSIERLEVLPRLPAGLAATEPARVIALRLARGEGRLAPVGVRAEEWGGYLLGDVLLRGYDRWGLFVYSSRVTARLPLRVYPRLERLKGAPQPTWTQAMAGNSVARQSGEGIEFSEIRPFVAGDHARRINWRVSARTRQLTVNQQHPERNADIVLFLDSFLDASHGRTGVLSLAVRAAAALADYYLSARDRVGLVSFGGYLRWLTPAAGAIQRYRIVEALLDTQIVLTYAWNELSVLPAHTLPPRSLVIALTPLLDGRSVTALLNLGARGFDILIVEISPLPFMQPEAGVTGQLARRLWLLQREVERDRFRRLGVPLVTWQPDQPLEAVIQEVRAFQRFARRQRA